MPFRLVSHATNADMNLLVDKGPNYSRGPIVRRHTISNCLPSMKEGTGKYEMVEVCARSCDQECVIAALTVSLHVTSPRENLG